MKIKVRLVSLTSYKFLHEYSYRYFIPLKIFMAFILPVAIPVYFWNESLYYAIVSQWFVRYMLLLNFTWSVNSAAHLWGNRPYDR